MAKKSSVKNPVSTKKRVKPTARPGDLDVQQPALISIDYPQPGEIVTSAQYTLRLSVPESASSVDVAVDGYSWQPARAAVGHWWFDWFGYQPGEHKLRARALTPEGEFEIERACFVKPQDTDLL